MSTCFDFEPGDLVTLYRGDGDIAGIVTDHDRTPAGMVAVIWDYHLSSQVYFVPPDRLNLTAKGERVIPEISDESSKWLDEIPMLHTKL